MLTGFPRTRWPRRRFSESYAVRISVKISLICEFRVIMGIMTGLLGCCSSSTLGSRANDYVKYLATLGFWLHHSPCSLGCWTNNTHPARSSPLSMEFSEKRYKYTRGKAQKKFWNAMNFKTSMYTRYAEFYQSGLCPKVKNIYVWKTDIQEMVSNTRYLYLYLLSIKMPRYN